MVGPPGLSPCDAGWGGLLKLLGTVYLSRSLRWPVFWCKVLQKICWKNLHFSHCGIYLLVGYLVEYYSLLLLV